MRSPRAASRDARLDADFADRRAGAFERAYERYIPLLVSVADAVVHNRMEAEDCVHDTLMRIWRDPASYQRGRGDLLAFLTVCVRNRAITVVRTAKRHAEIVAAHPRHDEDDAPEIPDYLQRSHLAAGLRALPAEQWKALQLSFFEHLTHEEIAQRLSLPLGTVKSRISLALRKLRATLPGDAA